MSTNSNSRPDIEALRALAVLPAVLHHQLLKYSLKDEQHKKRAIFFKVVNLAKRGVGGLFQLPRHDSVVVC